MKFGPWMEKLWRDAQILCESIYPRNIMHALLLSLDASKKILADQKRIRRDLRHLDQSLHIVFDSIQHQPRYSGPRIQRDQLALPATDDVMERLNQIIQNQHKLDDALLWLSGRVESLSRLHHAQHGDANTEADRHFHRRLASETQLEINRLKCMIWESGHHAYGESHQQIQEERLIELVFPLIQNKTLIDIGAHRGGFFSEMLEVGFETAHAIEPHPLLAAKLEERFGNDPRVHIHAVAMADEDGQMNLNVASPISGAETTEDPLLFSSLMRHSFGNDLEFKDQIPVSCRSLRSMTAEGLLPENAGLLKIDSEGFDSRILQGMPDSAPYEIIMSEYWGDEYLFSNDEIRSNGDAVALLKGRGYHDAIYIVRDMSGHASFTANQPPADPNVWGNSLYFRDPHLFRLSVGFIKRFMAGNDATLS